MGNATPEQPRSRLERAARWPLEILGRLVRVVPAALGTFFENRCTIHAAGIAYRVLFSLAPLAIVLVSVFGLVLTNETVREDVIAEVVDRIPVSEEGERDIADAIEKIATPASAIGFVSLIVFIWGASGMMGAIRGGLEAAMDVEQSRPLAKNKLVDFALVVGVGILVLSIVALNIAVRIVESAVEDVAEVLGFGEAVVSFIVRNGALLVLSMVVVMLIYRFVPAKELRFQDAVAGAFVTGLLLTLISAFSAFLFRESSQLTVVFGSITAVLVFLYAVYLYAAALLVGAAVAATWSKPPDPDEGSDEPFLTKVKQAVVGLFVHRDEERDEADRGTAQRPGG